MVKDRLPELLQRSSSVLSTVSGTNGSALFQRSSNVELKFAEMSAPMDAILNPYSEIRVQLAQISANLETMSRMVQTINIRNFNEKEMDELRTQNLKMGNQLMNKFKEFKANMPPENDFTLEARMKRTLFYGLYQSYIQIWTKNEEFLQLYERKLKKNLEMHSKIMNCNSTEEEIEELIANKTTNLFVGNILEETENERRTLRDLMDRFNELKKLEKSIEDVHALFLRIQTLVMEQSETINRVEFVAQQATHFVDKGQNKLQKAESLKKKALKKKFWLIGIALAVLIVLILIGIYL
ncbi:syntaxin-4 [Bactrocera neohumeralis]|uniref:syntaxin-4 n=1 Tax=Bactrocera tryoni TaxID=59916 RepID=UPI001A97D3B4|nr:syntaxin-4 [Bactrocera tryoni]XP_039960887.1 syntaxin-4 [Bactrocera tryoni]XP_039960888.1 syntaxin-4 [Bactrocera tryoni]XP_039960889.1 syntaxin-4 [Bactrocera tryoni]XP_039960891.1 syntaxin-4 [Bactrocera tryoni]XP_039960892.1 syntaxin-4 [Bactrocera tryoni]XP_039960893.1 syntaxin-4 [Bactrocera tryoni]XP_039960894.1 syntaxin-4 [Bactrocera tryoni]XP_039960895.1 syntaxin-4 [Bactrocera tryoni]XP_050329426.1 syntaxin-4 [Bactrocera neohumeralis]XP_050329427.1 syntaxin-4 [Bactrocera neohumerali